MKKGLTSRIGLLKEIVSAITQRYGLTVPSSPRQDRFARDDMITEAFLLEP
jgi:hypothetical protein